MRCDLCPDPIVVGVQEFVWQGAPMGHDQDLITYAAHTACHLRHNPEQAVRTTQAPPSITDDPAAYWTKIFGWGR